MRVLHVIDGIGVGGAELVLVQLVEHLQRRGVQNVILSLTPCGKLRKRLLASGAELQEFASRTGRFPVRQMVALIKAVRNSKPDVIQGWMYHGNFAASVLRDLSGLRSPMIWSMHNTLEPPPVFAWITKIAFHACRLGSFRPEHIIYVSRISAAQHEARNFRADKTVIIANGTDCDRFKPDAIEKARLRGALGLPVGQLLIGCFARWHPMKGHENLFQAASRLKRDGVLMHLVFAGTRMERTNMELLSVIQSAGLEDDCTLLGERHDVERLMAGLDGFVLPSIHSEAFPMVIGEAMATELPCIATDVGDCRYLLGDTSEIVAPDDVAALTNALRTMCAMAPTERVAIGAKGRDRIAKMFSIEMMVDAYQNLYASAGYRTNTELHHNALRE